MKLIFLHGLGQSAESWKEVQELLVDYTSEALDLFPTGVTSYRKAKEHVYQHLSKETEPFVCGSQDKPNLSSMKAIQELMSNSQFQIIPDGPHVLNRAKPKEFVEITRRFLELQK